MTNTPKPQADGLDEKIRQKKYAIAMYGYDAWGGSVWGNTQTIKKLEIEISNLKEYGKEYPSMWQKIRKKGKL